MKRILALLLFVSFSFAYFGNASIAVEKQWSVSGKPSSEMKLTGLFLVNDSNHRVIDIEAEAPLEIKAEGDRLVAFYNGPFNGSAVFRAKALVMVGYETDITKDEPLPKTQIRQNGLVEYDENMASFAKSIASGQSTLGTLASLSNWISDNVDYDLSYSGRFLPAKTVFLEPQGVCAEYTHLFIALANSLGLEARYVAGYVMTGDEWQPHSWAEVHVDGQWVSFDPTFRQAGILDNSHVAFSYGKDADSMVDKIESYGTADLKIETNLELIEDNSRKGDANVSFVFSEQEKKGRITVKNLRGDYLLGTYSKISPEENGREEKKVVVINPYGSYEDEYTIKEELEPGYSYSIPIMISFNDEEKVEKIDIKVKSEITEEDLPAPTCLSAFVITATMLLFRKSRKT